MADEGVHLSDKTSVGMPIRNLIGLIGAVLHISEARTCLVFSGLNAQTFVRPEGMAPPKESVQQDFEEL